MFGDRRAKFRSYWQIEAIAEQARSLGQITAHSQFDIISFIIGFLRLRLKGDLEIHFYEPDTHKVPAFVTFHGNEKMSLNVSTAIWRQAQNGLAFAKFVLAHEIGHILLHSHDALAYSELLPSALASIEAEERTEPQANLFADLFLVPTAMLDGFSCPDEICDYFNVTIECAQRRFDYISDAKRRQPKFYSGETCSKCLNFTLIQNGTCTNCDMCENTMG